MTNPIRFIDETARALEERPIPPGRFLVAFAGIVLARNLVEILVAQNPVFTPIQFFVHYPLAYVAPMLALILVLHLFSGVPIVRVTRLMLYAWALTLLPPLVDLVLGRAGESIGYLQLRFQNPTQVFLRFFDPTADFKGTTAGIRVETAVACLLGALYVWLRAGGAAWRWLRALGAAAGVYVCALGFFTLPRLFDALASAILSGPADRLVYVEPAFTRATEPILVMDRVRVLYLVPLCLVLGTVWLARADRAGLRRALRGSSLFTPAVAIVLAVAGVVTGAFVRARIEGRMPSPTPADWMAAGGLVLAAALVAWAADLFRARSSANEDGDAHRPMVGAVLAAAGLALGLGTGSSATVLLFAALGALVLEIAIPIERKIAVLLAPPALAVAGLALLAAGGSWAMDVDALATLPPKLVAGLVLALLGAATLHRLDDFRSAVSAYFENVPWGIFSAAAIAAGVIAAAAVPVIAGAGAPTAALCVGLVVAALLPRLFGRSLVVAEALALVAALTVGFNGALGTPATKDALIASAIERPKWVIREAMVLEEAGKYDEAISTYRRALRLDPSRAVVHARIGSILWSKQGRTEEAAAELQRACELDPGEVAARQQLGLLLLRQGRTDQAVVWLEQAARLAPKHPLVVRSYAEALSILPDRRRDAAEAWRSYLDVSRGHPDERPHREHAESMLERLE
jgi:tetratricopeptide (TPR) repeat protein